MTSEELKTRTKRFAIDVVKFCQDLKPTLALNIFSKQLIRCASSVGANYRAACRAKSMADFINKLKIVEEEADESIYFLELIAELEPDVKSKTDVLIKEGNELLSIVVSSITTSKKKLSNQKSKI
ncbi:MAG: four helix bundle protein [Cyclobacteriaceae bacterium]|nr:four helix bundle protein [Cyclobacteriaceae bacterium]UYN85879.1 MAG: four helix bundle protein [Cyclobacteriaceae bacterium]